MIYGIAADPVTASGGRPAEEVPLRRLMKYLCSNATPGKDIVDYEACRACVSQCAYGRRLLRELERENWP